MVNNEIMEASTQNTFMQYVQAHPLVGLLLSAGQALGGTLLNQVNPPNEIPTIYMQLFQIGAWTSAIIVGAVTTVGAIMKMRNDYIDRKNRKG